MGTYGYRLRWSATEISNSREQTWELKIDNRRIATIHKGLADRSQNTPGHEPKRRLLYFRTVSLTGKLTVGLE